MARVNKKITIVAGTPINLLTGMSSAAMLAAGFTSIPSKIVNELSIQALVGGTGVISVMAGIQGFTSNAQQWRVPSPAVSTDLTAQIAAATVSVPGGLYADKLEYQGIDIGKVWIDGAVSNDTVAVSYDQRS